jgi:hypothetical protein
MSEQEQKKSIKDLVLDRIKSGGIKMRPKIYFALKTLSIALGVLVVGFFLLFLISFITFSLRISGAWFLPGFGLRGFGAFLNDLPWLLILISALLIVVLEVLVKHFSFTYRRPILYSLLGIILVVLVGSFLVGETPLHPSLFQRAQEGRLPGIAPLYRDFGVPRLEDVDHGIVVEKTDNGFVIETPQGDKFTVVVSPKTILSPDSDVKEGDVVVVLGKLKDGVIQSFEIHKVEGDLRLFPSMQGPRQPFHRQ